MVNDSVHGRMNPTKAQEMLKELQEEVETTAVPEAFSEE
jgi:hypothetical protein